MESGKAEMLANEDLYDFKEGEFNNMIKRMKTSAQRDMKQEPNSAASSTGEAKVD